jgi:hypothetical protein
MDYIKDHHLNPTAHESTLHHLRNAFLLFESDPPVDITGLPGLHSKRMSERTAHFGRYSPEVSFTAQRLEGIANVVGRLDTSRKLRFPAGADALHDFDASFVDVGDREIETTGGREQQIIQGTLACAKT